MKKTLIGIDIADLRADPKDALRSTAAMAFDAVEIPTSTGELAPESLGQSGRRHLGRFISGLGLHLAALQADMPGFHLTDPARADERIARTIRVIELARDVGTRVVTTAVGPLTQPATGEPLPLAIEGLARLGEVAETYGIELAIRPSIDSGDRIANMLAAVACPALRVGWDPAAIVMRGLNPLAAIERYAEHVALVHIRDALAGSGQRGGQETGLGEGEVDLVGVLELLRSAEYGAPYILRRTTSERPVDELLAGRDVLLRAMDRS